MLAAESRYLQAAQTVDLTVLIFGGLCAVGFVAWLLRGGRWRNPLAGVEGTGAGPSISHIGIVLVMYVALGLLLMPPAPRDASTDQVLEPGSHRWHVAENADAAVKSLCAAAMVLILRQSRSFRAAAGAGHRPLAVLAAGVLGGLIAVPLCTVQLHMCTIVATWLEPDWLPPLHPVLLALEKSAWGPWGGLQLFVVAAVVTPVAEELFFRGLVLQAAWRYTRHAWISVLLSGLAFGGIHGQPQDILPLCTLGVLLGYVRLRTGSLSACFIIHAAFNARTMLLAIFFPELLGGD